MKGLEFCSGLVDTMKSSARKHRNRWPLIHRLQPVTPKRPIGMNPLFTHDSRRRTKSISRMLTLSLVLTIGLISITMIVAMYLYRIKTAKDELNQNADELLAYLVGIVERPLWDMNQQDIVTIGTVISRNELINHVIINDSYNRRVYTFERQEQHSLVHRFSSVHHEATFVGDVFFSLNRKTYDESINDMLLSSFLIVSVTTLLLIVTTGFLVRRFLKGPLSGLNAIVDAYSAGVYNVDTRSIPYVEFQPFGRVLNEMGIKITRHIRKVQQAEKNYRNIFENAVEGIFQSSPEGRYLSASPSMAKMMGYESPEALINAVSDIRTQSYVNPKERDTFVRLLLRNETVKGFEVQQYKKDGTTFWMSISGRLIRDGQGSPKLIEGFGIDVTSRKNLETQLRRAQKMETIGTLAGGIAHDFKNILGVMIGCTELAVVKVPPESQARLYLNKVLEACSRATNLVNQILTFSRQGESEARPVYFGQIIQETLKFIRATLPATIEIREEIDARCGAVLADPTQVHQVLMNLCTNAAHAMQPKGGLLEVGLKEVALTSQADPEEHSPLPQVHIELSIRDTGHGMPSETLERIFDPFFTTKPVGEGTGLGLSVVHGIVKKLNGSIAVESEPGTGSIFRVYFPRIDVAPVNPPDDSAGRALPFEPAKGTGEILLVDDEPLLVETLADMLRDLGYSVTETDSSPDAWTMFQAEPERFQAVVTDLTMPDMTGIDLARKMVQINPDIPILLCTGFSELLQEDTVRSAGIREILFKPVIRAQLSAAVRKALGRE